MTPSSLLAIDDPYVAYCLDSACAYIAMMESKGKRRQKPPPKAGNGKAHEAEAPMNNSSAITALRAQMGMQPGR